MTNRIKIVSGTSVLIGIMLLSACSPKESAALPKTSGALSGVRTIDSLVTGTSTPANARTTSLLGVFVSEYLTTVPTAMAAESALKGIDAQMKIIVAQQTIQDPDYDLLQAFGDALQVDVADLLNRSGDRQKALDVYSEALTNVATRSNDRLKELTSQLGELKKLASTQKKEQSTADRNLKKAIKENDFTSAGEQQKNLTELQTAFAETDLKQKQVQSLVDTLEDLLTLYGSKIFAIQENREALIAGIKVVDVPGAEELQVLETKRASRRGSTRGGYDALFSNPLVTE